MPLKIIHHREKNIESKKENFQIDIKQNLVSMFIFCEKIVNFSNLILDNVKHNDLLNFINNEDKEKNLTIQNATPIMEEFNCIFGKRTSLIDAVAKTTTVMEKICKLASNFDISLEQEQKDDDGEILTDEDIDIMVQLVKDFGEDQIREDARECREQKANNFLAQKDKKKEIDVYDVYHEATDNKHNY